MTEKKRRVIKSSKLAKELIKMGFVIIDIAQDRNNHTRTVFVFEDTEQLRVAINSLIEV